MSTTDIQEYRCGNFYIRWNLNEHKQLEVEVETIDGSDVANTSFMRPKDKSIKNRILMMFMYRE